MVRKLILAIVILAMAAVPVPALAWDGHGGRHEFRGGHERFGRHERFDRFGRFHRPFVGFCEPALRGPVGSLHLPAAVGAVTAGLLVRIVPGSRPKGLSRPLEAAPSGLILWQHCFGQALLPTERLVSRDS